MVSFLRSEGSTESMCVIDVANKFYVSVVHLAITCNENGDLSNYAKSNQNGHCIVLPQGTNDLGFAIASSFTSILLASIFLFKEKITLEEISKLNLLTQTLLDKNSNKLNQIIE